MSNSCQEEEQGRGRGRGVEKRREGKVGGGVVWGESDGTMGWEGRPGGWVAWRRRVREEGRRKQGERVAPPPPACRPFPAPQFPLLNFLPFLQFLVPPDRRPFLLPVPVPHFLLPFPTYEMWEGGEGGAEKRWKEGKGGCWVRGEGGERGSTRRGEGERRRVWNKMIEEKLALRGWGGGGHRGEGPHPGGEAAGEAHVPPPPAVARVHQPARRANA